MSESHVTRHKALPAYPFPQLRKDAPNPGIRPVPARPTPPCAAVSMALLPVPRAKINRFACPHIFHDLLNTPRLVRIALGIIRLKCILVLHVDALHHARRTLLVIFVRVCFGIVAPHPFGQLGLRAARVELDFGPVRVLQEFGVGEAELLCAGIANEAVAMLVLRE